MYGLQDDQDGRRSEIVKPNRGGFQCRITVIISHDVDDSISAAVDPIEELHAETAETVAASLQVRFPVGLIILFLRSQKLVQKLDEADQCLEEWSETDWSHMFPTVSLWGLSIGRIASVVPTCSSSSHQKTAGLDEEEDHPEEVKDMYTEKCQNGVVGLEVLIRVLMRCVDGSSKWVETKSFEYPQCNEENGHDEHDERHEDYSAIASHEDSSHFHDLRGELQSGPEAAHEKEDEEGQDEADDRINDPWGICSKRNLFGFDTEQIGTECHQRSDCDQNQDVDEAGCQASDEYHQNKCQNDSDRNRKKNEWVILHESSHLLGLASKRRVDVALKRVRSRQADSVDC